MKHCQKCNLDMPDSYKFCKSCGGELTDKGTIIQSGLRCPSCVAEVKAEWRFCNKCAYELLPVLPIDQAASALTCQHCGAPYREGMGFCNACGKPLRGQEVEQPAVPLPDKPFAPPGAPEQLSVEAHPPTEVVAQEVVKCRKCGVGIRAGLKFCEVCGTPVALLEEELLPTKRRWKPILAAVAPLVLIGFLVVGWHLWGVRVTVVSNPPGAQVYLDEKEVGRTGDSDGRLTLAHVRRGQHTLRVKREGFEDLIRPLDLRLSEFSKSIDVNLKASELTLTIVTVPPGCKVLLDEREVGISDETEGKLVLGDVRRGQHSVTVQREGYQGLTQTLSLESNQMTTVKLVVQLSKNFLIDELDVTVGSVAPDFVLQDLKGRPVQLSKLRGRVVVVNFWATWCGPCRAEIPGIVKVYKQYRQKGLEIVGISLDQAGRDVVEDFVKENGIRYPVALDTSQVAQQYGGITAIPTTFIIDRQGRIAKRHVGYMDQASFEAMIAPVIINKVTIEGQTTDSGSVPEASSRQPLAPTRSPAEIQQQVAEHISRARALFEKTQYQAALKECNEALKIDPKNQEALKLKEKIKKTIDVLSGRP
jgi:peroxiredoxin